MMEVQEFRAERNLGYQMRHPFFVSKALGPSSVTEENKNTVANRTERDLTDLQMRVDEVACQPNSEK